jgi:hypothetical protein
MKYTIIKGDPTAQELIAIQSAMSFHRREVLIATVRKSVFALPQLRKPFNPGYRFGRAN